MTEDAGLLAVAERVLLEVAHRAAPADADVALEPLLDTATDPGPTTLHRALHRHGRDDVALLAALGVTAPSPVAVLGPEGRGELTRCTEALLAALEGADAADPARAPCLLAAALRRCFLAHQLAFALGSTACPLPEELARPLLERTAADAARWRAVGYFREPLDVPPQASWRDRFLRATGRDPHPGLHSGPHHAPEHHQPVAV